MWVITRDNTVDISDYSLLRGNFGSSGAPPPTSSVSPSPPGKP